MRVETHYIIADRDGQPRAVFADGERNTAFANLLGGDGDDVMHVVNRRTGLVVSGTHEQLVELANEMRRLGPNA